MNSDRQAHRPAPGAPGTRVERHDSVGSTNTIAFAKARDGDQGDVWVTANEQTAGRGRRGRHWESGRGNLFASYLLVDPAPSPRIGELPLVAALTLAEAIDRAAGTHNLALLKWPNDLISGGAKLSGILLEAEALANGRFAVVLGFGVNCVSHPQSALYPCTDLAALGYRVLPEVLFGHLQDALNRRLLAWRAVNGFEDLRRAWLARAAHLGQSITVRVGDDVVSGTFLDLDARGHLVLCLETGERKTVFAGDVFLPDLQPHGSSGAFPSSGAT
ncbi:MAG: biotin--[acetyl-CoA-carboxylase] ligase [Roseibium sp.]|nr:biotin--[acetyl-CoA-carboxylase] ligase [Roseibium sp.]